MFENKYFSTDEMLKEYIIKVSCKKLIIKGTLMGILGVVLSMLALRKGESFGVYATATIIIIIATIVTPIITYREVKKSDKALHGHKKHQTVVRFDDKIHMIEGSVNIEIDYAQIQEIHILKKSCVLMFGKYNAIMLEQNSFTKGTFDEFLVFIREKCVNLKK